MLLGSFTTFILPVCVSFAHLMTVCGRERKKLISSILHLPSGHRTMRIAQKVWSLMIAWMGGGIMEISVFDFSVVSLLSSSFIIVSLLMFAQTWLLPLDFVYIRQQKKKLLTEFFCLHAYFDIFFTDIFIKIHKHTCAMKIYFGTPQRFVTLMESANDMFTRTLRLIYD